MSSLLHTFFEAASDAVRCLAHEPGFKYENDVHAFTETGERLVTLEEAAPSFFLASARFSTDRVAGEITFGDREFFINMVLAPTSFTAPVNQGFGLWEWVAALDMVDPRASGGQFALTPDGVRTVVSDLGAVLSEIWPKVAVAGSAVVATIQAARARRRQESADAEAERDHERLAAQAADAFRERDYTRVIALLAPITSRLTNAERTKLHIARRHAESAGRTLT